MDIFKTERTGPEFQGFVDAFSGDTQMIDLHNFEQMSAGRSAFRRDRISTASTQAI
jgi:hypothetical protein